MGKNKSIVILVIVTVIVVLAAIFSKPSDHEISGAGERVYPDLLDKVNDITYVQVTRRDGVVTLTKQDENWHLKEKGGYPASVNKVREVILGVANLKRMEPKTSNPESYPKIGVQDVNSENAAGTHINMIAGSERKLVDIIVGNSKPSRADTSQQEYYIRDSSDPQAWLATGKLPTQWEAKSWLDDVLLTIDRDRIQQVKVNHADGEEVFIHRDSPNVQNFTLASLKKGEEINAPFEVNNIATTWTTTKFDDVKPAADLNVDGNPEFVALLTAFDGLEIKLEAFKQDDKVWSRYSATFNESIAAMNKEKFATPENDAQTNGSEPDSTADNNENSPTPAADTSKPAEKEKPVQIKSATDVKQEVDTHNALWKDWWYQLPQFRIDNISKKKQALLKKAENAAPPHGAPKI